MVFQNRQQAGKLLSLRVQEYKGLKKLIVLGIPRGGVIVAKELAASLSCPLDIIITKKIGAPGNPELAVGAVGPASAGGSGEARPVVDEELAARVGADEKYIKNQILKIEIEISEREKKFRAGQPLLDLKDKIVIIADDGVATGSTMQSAIEIVRQQEPKKIVVAVPVIAKDSLAKIQKLADEVVYLEVPEMFFSLSQFYQEFEQVSDEEAANLLS